MTIDQLLKMKMMGQQRRTRAYYSRWGPSEAGFMFLPNPRVVLPDHFTMRSLHIGPDPEFQREYEREEGVVRGAEAPPAQ